MDIIFVQLICLRNKVQMLDGSTPLTKLCLAFNLLPSHRTRFIAVTWPRAREQGARPLVYHYTNEPVNEGTTWIVFNEEELEILHRLPHQYRLSEPAYSC